MVTCMALCCNCWLVPLLCGTAATQLGLWLLYGDLAWQCYLIGVSLMLVGGLGLRPLRASYGGA